MLLDTSSEFLWTGDELAVLDDNHSNILVFSCPYNGSPRNAPPEALDGGESLVMEHVLSIPVYQYAQVSLIPTAESTICSISLVINEAMLAVIDRHGGLTRIYSEEQLGYSFTEIHGIMRLAEMQYLLLTSTDIVELDLNADKSVVYTDSDIVPTLHMSDHLSAPVTGHVQNINPKYVYAHKHLYLLTMISNDIYLLKIYDLASHQLVFRIYFSERVVSLQALPCVEILIVTDVKKIYLASPTSDGFKCSAVSLKGFTPGQNIEKLLLLKSCVAIETETRVQYLYAHVWDPEALTLTLTSIIWSDDTSLDTLGDDGSGSTRGEQHTRRDLLAKIYAPIALHKVCKCTPRVENRGLPTVPRSSAHGNTICHSPSSVCLLPRSFVIRTVNTTSLLLIMLDNSFALVSSDATTNEASYLIYQSMETIFSEILSVILGTTMPFTMILSVTVTSLGGGEFIFRLLNLSTGSTFEFSFFSNRLSSLLETSSSIGSSVFRSYGVFSVGDYLVIWLLGGNICFGFYVYFKNRTCHTVEFTVESDAYFMYPLVRLLYASGDDSPEPVCSQYLITYYIIEMNILTDAYYEDPSSHAVAGQRTVLSFFVATRMHILTTFKNCAFKVTEIATIVPISLQYEMILQESKIVQAILVPYLILSDSSFIIMVETTIEMCFYLIAFDPQKGTTEVSLLEHDIALTLLSDSIDSLVNFGFTQLGTFHLKGLIDFYISGVLHRKFKDKIAKTVEDVTGTEDQVGLNVMSPKKIRQAPTAFSDALLKGTIENLLSLKHIKDTQPSVGSSALHLFFENVSPDTHSTFTNATLASINDQLEKVVVYKQYNPYFSISAARKHKKVRNTLYYSVDNEFESSDDPLSEQRGDKDNSLLAQDSRHYDDGLTSIFSLEKKLDMLRKTENYAGEYAMQPMKARVSRFIKLCINLTSSTSKQSIIYNAELEEIERALKEIENLPREQYSASFSVPMTPSWVDEMITQFTLCYPTSDHTLAHRESDINAIKSTVSDLLQSECSPLTYGQQPNDQTTRTQGPFKDSKKSFSSNVNELLVAETQDEIMATYQVLQSAMLQAATDSSPSALNSIVLAYLSPVYYSLGSPEFFRIYNCTQKILATILIMPLKQLFHKVFTVIAQKNGLITKDLQDSLRLGHPSAAIYQDIDFFASDLINCREILHFLSDELALEKLYNYRLSFTLSCLSALLMTGVLQCFLQDADRTPFVSAVSAAIVHVLDGYLRAHPGEIPSLRLVFSFLILDSSFSKFAAIAFMRLLISQISHLYISNVLPIHVLHALILETNEICELNFSILSCQNLLLMHILVIHREIFSKVVLILETLAFLKDSAIYDKLKSSTDEHLIQLLDDNLDAAVAVLYKFRNNLADSSFKSFSPGFASYFLKNLGFLLHTFCTYSVLLPGQHNFILLKTVALQELVDSSPALIASCRGLSTSYRKTLSAGHESDSQNRLHESFFTDTQRILSEHLTTLSVRSLYAFTIYLKRYEPQVWRCHSTRFIQLIIFLMQRLSTLDRVGDKLTDTDLLTTFPLERSIFNRRALLASLRERLFDLSYSLSPVTLVRFSIGNDISILHGFIPGLLSIKFLESSTKALNIRKPLVTEASYTHFLEHAAERYSLANVLPHFTELGYDILGVSSLVYKQYSKVLPCISFISVDPQNEFTLVYCHNYSVLLLYKLSVNIDDVYLIEVEDVKIFTIIHPNSHQLLVARVLWIEEKKALKTHQLCEVQFIHGNASRKIVEGEDYIWKTKEHIAPLQKLVLFSVKDEQKEYEHKHQEERHADAKDATQKLDKRHIYHISKNRTVLDDCLTIRFKLKRKIAI